jgi:hypothetical protein
MSVSVLVRLFFWLWFAAAVALGHFRALERLPPAGIPLVVFGTAGALLYAYFRLPALRAWVDALDLRALVLLHVTRFVGIYFLVLHQRGDLPRAFAIPAGIGDIAVAAMALPVALAPLTHSGRRRVVTVWNVVGLVDILLVAATAARLNLADPAQMWTFRQLPLALLPTFLVPLIIATHVIIFVRLARTQRAA